MMCVDTHLERAETTKWEPQVRDEIANCPGIYPNLPNLPIFFPNSPISGRTGQGGKFFPGLKKTGQKCEQVLKPLVGAGKSSIGVVNNR